MTFERHATTIDLAAATNAPPITEGMKVGVVMGDKRYIYLVDEAQETRGGYRLDVTLLETQQGTPIQD